MLERDKERADRYSIMFGARLLALINGGIKEDPLFTMVLLGTISAILWIFNCTYILHTAGVTIRRTYTAILKQTILRIPYTLIPIIVWYIAAQITH